jgi:erythritol transport system permease protein
MGGRGNIRGTLLGAFVIGFLSDGLVIIGVSQYWQMVFKGAVIVLAVMLNAVEYKAKKPATPASPDRDRTETDRVPVGATP